MSGLSRLLGLGVLLPALFAGMPQSVKAQGGFAGAAQACAASPEIQADGICPVLLGAVRGARAGLLTAVSGGTPMPGTASTLGRRFPGSARYAFGGTVQLQQVSLLDLVSTARPRTDAQREGSVVALRGAGAVGVFHGFSPRPTVGGILSVDLVGAASYLFLPASAGWTSGVPAWGVGARVGLLRESFTLPGITVSAVRHSVSSVELETDPEGSTRISTTGWSLRGIVGKDLAGIGLYAGVGQDRGQGRFTVSSPPSTGPTPPIYPTGLDYGSGSLPARRNSLFAGGVYTVLVAQISGELGWASGFDPVDAGSAGVIPGSDGMLFVSLLGRITF